MRMIVVRPVYLMELVIVTHNEFQVIVVHPMTSRLPPRPKTLRVSGRGGSLEVMGCVSGRGGSLEVMGWTTMTEHELFIYIILW